MMALVLSLKVACVATVLAAMLALMVVYVVRARSAFLSVAVSSLAMLPLVLPPTVLGYYLLTSLGPDSVIGRSFYGLTHQHIAFTQLGCVLAASITAVPVVFQATLGALDALDPSYAEQAATLGLSRFRIFVRIELPLVRTAALAGLALGFARALGDFGATMMFAGSFPGRTQTASIAVYEAFQSGDLALANQLAVALAGLGFAVVFGVGMLSHRAQRVASRGRYD
jgi:molybdate transport system permease protein